jgi:hypothetical protein
MEPLACGELAFTHIAAEASEGKKSAIHHRRGMAACQSACIRHNVVSLLYWLQEMLDGTLADLAAMLDSLLDRFAKMIPNQNARDPVLISGLREAGV